MAKRTTYDYTDGAGRKGRAYQAGIAKLLAGGRRLTVQRTDRIPKPNAGERIVRAARAELGVVERPPGSNSGPRVEVYQASTTEPGTGWPWCVAYTRYVLDRAGVLLDGYRGAYCPSLETWARAAKRWAPASATPKPGWLVLFDWGGDGVADHVGVVEREGADDEPDTIEGNAQSGTAGDQSNGGGVFARSDRTGRTIRGYVKTW